jgi:hypothetical protein
MDAVGIRTRIILRAVGNLPGDDGKADLLFGEVVVGRERGVVQKSKDVAGVVLPPNLVEESLVIRVRQLAVAQVDGKATLNVGNLFCVPSASTGVVVSSKPSGLVEELLEFLPEVAGGIRLRFKCLVDVALEMGVTFLLRHVAELLGVELGSPVADQSATEILAKHFDYLIGAVVVTHVVQRFAWTTGAVRRSEGDERGRPAGFPPPRWINMHDSGLTKTTFDALVVFTQWARPGLS